MKKYEKKEIRINLWVIILFLMVSIMGIIYLAQSRINKLSLNLSPENQRAMTYEQYKEGDEAVDGTNNVKFNAFFLRDLNGDGEAETIYGSCKEIGEKDTLYMEIIVQTAGTLKDAKIQIDGKNFNLQTALPKDKQLKNDYIGNDIKQIEFNNLNNGTQKLLAGIVKSGVNSNNGALGGNINNYTRNDNKVILTGTYVPEEGSPIQIRKEINLTMDWYGTTKAKVYTGKDFSNAEQVYEDIQKRVDEENGKVTLDFYINTSELNKQLYISKNYVEATIPELNGYAPIEVKETTNSCTCTYDNNSKKLIMEKNAIVDETGKITNYLSSRNTYKVQVTYSIEAYQSIGEDSITIKIPVETYYEGFNNNNEEFENPHKSNIAKDTIVANYTNPKGTAALFEVTVGKHIYSPRNRYIVSKQKPLKLYSSISSEEKDDKYTVLWTAYTGTDGQTSGMIMKETKDGETQKTDSFIKSNSTEESINDITTNIGIYFTGAGSMLKEDGWINVYNEENNELIETFTKENWNKYTAKKPYIYDEPVKHIRIETSETNKESTLKVYNIKELNDSVITTKYTKEKFDELKYIKSNIAGYLGDSFINTNTHQAVYEAPFSMTEININNNKISTQETCKNFEIEINAISDIEQNQVGWYNAQFLLKIPDEILITEINRVYIKESGTDVTSYELIENEKGKFIKINTKNDLPKSFTIVIDADITPDPRISTMSRSFELYAYNEEICDYYNGTKDIYDVNNNSNTDEKVNKSSTSISLISPNSLVTHQTASEFDENHTVVISPQIAELKPINENDNLEKSTVKIGVELRNNYANTISNVVILGKIPFEGNTYVLSGGDLKSKFSTTMKNTGIEIPEELEGKVTIYYSEQEKPTKEIEKSENGWKTKENVTDWTKIKTFLIDFGNNKLDKGDGYTFNYTVEIPYGVEYNKVAYSHHGVYFSLDTDDGKYRTQTEPNKIGIRIAEKYQLEINKYQIDKEKLVPGATYKVTYLNDEGKKESKTAVTDSQGKILMANLYVEKEYEIQEIASPELYELNADVIKIIGHKDENGNLSIEKISGNTKGDIRVEKEENKDYKAIINVEDEVRASISITKTEQGTNKKLQNAEFEITGKEINKTLVTDRDGKISLNGFYLNEEYTIKELKAKGHYLIEPIKFKIVKNNTQYAINILEGSVKNTTITFIDEIPNFNLEIENEKIPTYNLKVIKEDEDGNKLSDAQFIISGEDEDFKTSRKSNEDGKFDVEGLYQYIEGKNITGKYKISEFKSPKGYVNNNEEITFVVSKNQSNELEVNVENKDNLSTLKDATVDGNTVTITITNKPLFKLTKIDADTKEPLANVKFVIKQVNEYGKEVGFAKDVDGNYVGTKDENNQYVVTTNENGIISLPLPNGSYKATEILTPVGYEQPSTAQYFSISSNEEEVVVEDNEDNTTETLEINYIEDLIDLSNNIINGNTYEGTKVVLKRILDFKEDSSYRDATSTAYGDYDGDGNINSIKEECTTGKGFKGIGQLNTTSNDIYFSGVFDGNKNEIRNIKNYYNKPYASFFGYVKNAKIKNLGITGEIKGISSAAGFVTLNENVTIYNCYNKVNLYNSGYNPNTAGILCGYSSNHTGKIVIKNCYNEGVLGESNTGGIASMCLNEEMIIDNCYNNCSFKCNRYSGGIYGSYYIPRKLQIKNSYNLADLEAKGGIIGDFRSSNIEIENCYNFGNITGETRIGGIVGGEFGSYENVIRNCYNFGNITSNGNYVGGIIAEGGSNLEIYDCYNLGNVTGVECVGGIVGENAKIISNCFNLGSITGKKHIGGIAGQVYSGDSTISKVYNRGTIICASSNPYSIGGIVGYGSNATITDVYNEGKISIENDSNNNYVGGIVGSGSSCTISNAYVNIENQQKIFGTINGDNSYNDRIQNSYYLNGMTAVFTQGTPVTKEQLASNEFFEQLNVNDVWEKQENDAPTIKGLYLKTKAVSELIVRNRKLQFNITTDIEELDGVKGGTISGEDATPYETVIYAKNSTQEIKMIPDNGYKITKITINGVDYAFTPNNDGTFTMPLFENMMENKHIVVTFSAIKNEVKINKVDSLTKEKIGKAKFKIEQQPGDSSVNNAIGSLKDNSAKYNIIEPTENEVTSEVLSSLTKNGTYYFIEQNGKYIPNNASMESTKTADSYLEIDLTNKDGNYVAVVNASMNNNKNYCKGYAKVTENTTAPSQSDYDLMFNLIGTVESQNYNSILLEGGKKYYLHLGYYHYYSSWAQSTGYMTINSIKVYGAKTTEKEFNFANNEGKYVSTNQSKANTTCNSYIPIDLTNNTGKYRLNLNTTLSGKGTAYATITESTDRVDSNYSIRRIIKTSSPEQNRNYSIDLQGGKMYYLHLGYEKQDNSVTGTDTFTINSVSISNISSNTYSTEFTTNEQGQAKLQLPYGNYTITELEAPEGYEKLSQPVYIEFKQDGTNEFNIENTKLGKVIVHHYLKDKNGTYTTTKLAEDEMMQDKVGEDYTTKPNLNISGYTIEKDNENNYVVPSNSYGKYTDKDIEVKYYYEEAKIPLIVHHYIEGTTTPVPLANGENAQDEYSSGYKGESYTTSQIENSKLSAEYELVEKPSNAEGTYDGEGIEVTYFYKKIQRKLNLIKYAEDGTTQLPGAKFSIKNNKDNSVIGEFTTNSNGKITLDLEAGSYTLKETQAPDTYKLDETEKTIEVNRDTTTVDVGFVNEKIKGTVTVHHYIQGTTTPVKLKNGENAKDGIKTGAVGETYTTKPADNVAEYYELVDENPEKASGEYIEGNIDVIYYYKLKDYGYRVEYYYDEVIDNSKTENKSAKYGEKIDNYTDKVIDGYVFDKTEGKPLTISTDTSKNVIKVYYVRRADLSYTVNYLEKGTNKVLKTAKVVNNKAFNDIIRAVDEVEPISKYNYDSSDKETLTIGTDNSKNVINLYYTKKDASLVVKYVDEITNQEISTRTTQQGKVDDEYTTTAKEIQDYVLTRDSGNTKGTLAEDEITVIYYYKHKSAGVVVNHLDVNTNKSIADQETKSGKEGDSYTTHEKEIEGYDLVTNRYPENATGTMKKELTTVNYYYVKKTKVTAKYIDKNSNKEIADREEITGHEKDSYTTETKDIENYVLVEEPENKSGTMTAEPIEVIYYYAQISAGVVEKHIDEFTEELLDSKTYQGNEGDTYTTSSKEFEGYELDREKLPINATGTMTTDPIEVKYYYKYKTKVITKYVDKITGKEIVPSITTNGHVGDEYQTEKKEYDEDKEETIPFKEYNLVEEPTNKTGTMTKAPITVIYYYVHNSAGVIVKHIDVKTNKEIAKQDKITGHEGDSYETKEKEIKEYDLVTEKYPENAKGKMKKEETEVKYYYIKKSKVTVKYIDRITGKELTDDIVIKGHEGDDYETEEKTFDGYTLEKVPENAKGKIGPEEEIVIYYYLHNSAGVKVNHYDVITGEKLAKEEKIEGHEGDNYETKEKEIEGYEIVKERYPENAKGKMKIEETKVNYYYIHKAKVIVKYKDKNTGEEIAKEEKIEGNIGETYETEEKKIENYEIEKELYPQNTKGTMTKEDIEVIYYYKKKTEVISKYIEKETGKEIEEKETIKGYEGEEYKTNKKDIKNYKLIEEPKNKEGKMTKEPIEVIYYYRKAIFNLSIDKKVKEIQVNGETKKINKDIAKVEVKRKKIKDTEVKVVYTIKVTNDGEIEGSAIIEENIPEGMIMLEEDNKEWNIKEDKATITTNGIKPGESVEYIVVLTWNNSNENFGTKENIVKITETKNEVGFEEKDTNDNEDDAQFIITVSTGAKTAVRAAGITTIVLSAIGVCIVVIKRKTKE